MVRLRSCDRRRQTGVARLSPAPLRRSGRSCGPEHGLLLRPSLDWRHGPAVRRELRFGRVVPRGREVTGPFVVLPMTRHHVLLGLRPMVEAGAMVMIADHLMIVFVIVLRTGAIAIMAMEVIVVEMVKAAVPPTGVAVICWIGWIGRIFVVAGAPSQAKCRNRQHTKSRKHVGPRSFGHMCKQRQLRAVPCASGSGDHAFVTG
jgi:hypothetical protein